MPETIAPATAAAKTTRGLTVRDLARMAGVDRETMARALEHHGYLELAPYGGPSRRRLLTSQAEAAGIGWNIYADRYRLARLEGHHRACAFPVFAPEHAPDVLWTLDLDGIRRAAAEQPGKRARLRWLLAHHDYLPSGFIADLAGCTPRAVEKARARAAGESSVMGYNTIRGNCRGPEHGNPQVEDHHLPP